MSLCGTADALHELKAADYLHNLLSVSGANGKALIFDDHTVSIDLGDMCQVYDVGFIDPDKG